MLAQFTADRQAAGDALQALSEDNYLEMSYTSGLLWFQAKKKVELVCLFYFFTETSIQLVSSRQISHFIGSGVDWWQTVRARWGLYNIERVLFLDSFSIELFQVGFHCIQWWLLHKSLIMKWKCVLPSKTSMNTILNKI